MRSLLCWLRPIEVEVLERLALEADAALDDFRVSGEERAEIEREGRVHQPIGRELAGLLASFDQRDRCGELSLPRWSMSKVSAFSHFGVSPHASSHVAGSDVGMLVPRLDLQVRLAVAPGEVVRQPALVLLVGALAPAPADVDAIVAVTERRRVADYIPPGIEESQPAADRTGTARVSGRNTRRPWRFRGLRALPARQAGTPRSPATTSSVACL